MFKTVLLEIKTDRKIVYSSEVLSVTLKDINGQNAYLPHHCDTIKRINDAIISIKESDSSGSISERKFEIHSGYMNIDKNGIAIFTPYAKEISC